MLYLVELDHLKSGSLSTPEAGRAFIEGVIFPTLAQAELLVKEGKILSGGPVLGRIGLRFIAEADSAVELDRMLLSLPVWPVAETRVTPLIAFGERRDTTRDLLKRLAT
jgi:D-serine deaminase-like pyridoxal phosphate-dependent protein